MTEAGAGGVDGLASAMADGELGDDGAGDDAIPATAACPDGRVDDAVGGRTDGVAAG